MANLGCGGLSFSVAERFSGDTGIVGQFSTPGISEPSKAEEQMPDYKSRLNRCDNISEMVHCPGMSNNLLACTWS